MLLSETEDEEDEMVAMDRQRQEVPALLLYCVSVTVPYLPSSTFHSSRHVDGTGLDKAAKSQEEAANRR